MTRSIVLRLAVPALLAAASLPGAVFSQSQDSQSVADAARKAKEQKKAPEKPAKVFTDDDVKPASATPASGGAQASTSTATSTSSAAPAASAANAANPSNAPAESSAAAATSSSAAEGAKDEKEPKEVKDLRDQLKKLQSDLDWLQRELRLDMDAYYSKPDYAGDTAGKQKLDDETQKVSDKQQEVDSLKAKLADLLQSLGITESTASAPPKP